MSKARARLRRWSWIPLTALSLLLIGAGLHRGEFATIKAWFDGLCTSCIGLTVP
ncbi:MAG TPA: hypothetical protein VGM19_10890 [Armatimonadota bacterium]|jgi:hypothetical protein